MARPATTQGDLTMRDRRVSRLAKREMAHVVICALLICGVWLIVTSPSIATLLHFDTLARREAVADRLRQLKAEVEGNPENVNALDEIEECVHSPYRFERQYALSILGELGPLAEPKVEIVATFLASPDRFDRVTAAQALSKMGQTAAPATNELIDAVYGNVNNSTGIFSAEALANIGTGSPEVLTVLEFGKHNAPEPFSGVYEEALETLTKRDE